MKQAMSKPKPRDERICRPPVPDPETPPAPVTPPEGIRIPPALANLRGIRHPPLPPPVERPEGYNKRDWYRCIVPEKSPLHDACARGTA